MKPDFTQISAEEALKLFLEIRRDFIVHLSKSGLSQREISRRIGGSSIRAVNLVLNKGKEPNEN